jgi:predicted transcriptional regulator
MIEGILKYRTMWKAMLGDKVIRDELSAIARTLIFLAAGLGIFWHAKTKLAIAGEGLLISLLLLPLLVYVIISGRIQELKAPGGLEAKFRTLANESISAASETVRPEPDEIQAVLKESPMVLQQKVQDLDDSKPILMLMQLGSNSYSPEAAIKYLDTLSKFRNFRFVVFLDHRKRLVGHMSAWSVRALLQKAQLGNEFIDSINRGLSAELMRYPGFETEVITKSWSNANALKEMVRRNVDALLVVNERKELEGVVEREQVISLMILSLVDA